MKPVKPLDGKAYGSIPHLPGSKFGNRDDKGVDEKLAAYFLEKPPGKHDTIIVLEKVDGSCVSIANINGILHALTKSGYEATTSPFLQHHYFAEWVRRREEDFHFLNPGQRLCGEWMMQAHGTRYNLAKKDILIFFDFFIDEVRMPFDRLLQIAMDEGLSVVNEVARSSSDDPFGSGVSIREAIGILGEHGFHNALDTAEGCVWRWERPDKYGQYDFIKRPVVMAKYVRPEKTPGCYLGYYEGEQWIQHPPTWNRTPEALFE